MDLPKNEEVKFVAIIEFATKALNMIGKITVTWIISYYTYLSIKSLAGTTTITSIVISFFMERTVAEKLSYGANVGLSVCLYLERKSRKKLIKAKSKEISTLIAQIDKNKGTSNLTEYGDTNKNDE
mgnify:FL=1